MSNMDSGQPAVINSTQGIPVSILTGLIPKCNTGGSKFEHNDIRGTSLRGTIKRSYLKDRQQAIQLPSGDHSNLR